VTYRRPTVQTFVLTATIALIASAMMALSRPVELRIDGQRVESDVPPITTAANHVYVPLRTIADALGAETEVDGDRVYVIRGHQSLRIRLGDQHATLNGMPLTFAHPPFRVRGRVMIGLTAVANAFGIHASYDARSNRIDVLTPGIGEAAGTTATTTQ
jgi:hypothetical protein